MTMDNKIYLMGQFYAENFENPLATNTEFWGEREDMLQVCLYQVVGWVKIQERLFDNLELTWTDFCEFLNVDHYGEWETYDELMAFVNE